MNIIQNCTIVQNAFVVRNIDAAIAKWLKFGAGPFFTTSHDILYDISYRGRPATLNANIATGQAGSITIEFVEVTEEGPNVYHDIIPRGKEGFHHIAVIPDDFEKEKHRYNRLGYETINSAKYGDGLEICFLDTYDDLGFVLELHSDHPFIREAHKRIKAASIAWDGVTRPSRPITELFEGS